jgi:hypothetical protein
MAGTNPPLIVTLSMRPEDQQFFNELRDTHFPSHVNYLQAHITLFHHLPSDEPFIQEQLKGFADHPVIELEAHGIRHLGNGVAYSLRSPALMKLHARMQSAFQPWLNFKDRQELWPHITIQNKATAFKAHQLFEQLSADFKPFTITTTGLSTWLYLKGPWKSMDQYFFV